MKRLFCVKASNNRVILPRLYDMANELEHDGTYFGNKQDAKRLRDYDNKTYGPGSYISRGPDHIGPHGTPGPSQMRRQPPTPYNEYR